MSKTFDPPTAHRVANLAIMAASTVVIMRQVIYGVANEQAPGVIFLAAAVTLAASVYYFGLTQREVA